jgi:CDP-diacylglycerol--glycerol-3-phosphate 3-phosphatidyltransferase
MQNFGVSFYILPLPSELFILRDLFMAAAVVLTITTGVDYVLQWWKSRKR